MQMLPSTARETAIRAKVPFDDARFLNDPVFNTQLGASHLGNLLKAYNGSYILTFAAYNAGSRRVQEWINQYGDPRRANVDPVDWIERIPVTETRQYVQKVMENLEVYRSHTQDIKPNLADGDLRRAETKG
jgi:soluble lytic murein transglycosylase